MPISVPTVLLSAVIASCRDGGTPKLPDGSRGEAEAWLKKVLQDRELSDAHIDALRAIQGLPQPFKGLPKDLYLEFPGELRLLSEDTAIAIENGGLESVGDDVIAEILTNPMALQSLWTGPEK